MKLSLHLNKPNTDLVCKELRELEGNSVEVIVDVPVGGSKFGASVVVVFVDVVAYAVFLQK